MLIRPQLFRELLDEISYKEVPVKESAIDLDEPNWFNFNAENNDSNSSAKHIFGITDVHT